MGMHTLQQARIEHPETFIIALASQRHHARLRKLGANEVFDYSSPSVVADVRKLGRDVRRAIDCHSEGRSTALAAECMLPNDQPETCDPKDRRRIIRTLPPGMISGTIPPSVRADEWILSYTALGKVSCPSSVADWAEPRLIRDSALLVPVQVLRRIARRLQDCVDLYEEAAGLTERGQSRTGTTPSDAGRAGRYWQGV